MNTTDDWVDVRKREGAKKLTLWLDTDEQAALAKLSSKYRTKARAVRVAIRKLAENER